MMSEKKYNAQKSGSAEFEPEQTVSGVEQYSRPRWLRFAGTAAACLGLISAAVGGAYLLRGMSGSHTQLSEVQTEGTAVAGEQAIAPFGDFEDMEFYIPDYTRSGSTLINVPDTGGYHEVPPGDIISQDKRRALADFFNDYDWVEANSDRVTGEVEEFCRFICDNGSTVTSLAFYTNDIMVYLRMEYHEEDGLLVRSEDVRYTDYAIDSKLFEKTISEILGISLKTPSAALEEEAAALEEEVAELASIAAEETSQAAAAELPFDDFAELDYYVPEGNGAEYSTLILETNSDGASILHFNPGDPIVQEKREKILGFFNSCDWEKWKGNTVEATDAEEAWKAGKIMSFMYFDDSQVRLIYLDGLANEIVYQIYEYVEEDDELRCTNFEDWVANIDYDYVSAGLQEILSSD